MNLYFLAVAVVDLGAVVVHGYVGHRLILTPLTTDRLFPTREFGDADMSRRVLVVTWHAVTGAFACSAAMMALWAFGLATTGTGPMLVSAMHASFLVVGLAVVTPRIKGLLGRPIPVAFVTFMTTAALLSWLGTG